MGRGGESHEAGGRSGSRGRAACEVGRAAAGRETRPGGTGVEGAASGPAGGSGGGGGKAGGSGSCGRTGRGAGAWGRTSPSRPGPCGADWRGVGCGR